MKTPSKSEKNNNITPLEFLCDDKLQERFFYLLERIDGKNKHKTFYGEMERVYYLDVFRSLNIHTNTKFRINKWKSNPEYKDRCDKFIERFDSIIDGIVRNREESFMKDFLIELEKNQYGFSKTLKSLNRSFNVISRLEEKYGYHTKVLEFIKQNQNILIEKDFKERLKLFDEITKKGVDIKYSRIICGLEHFQIHRLRKDLPELCKELKKKFSDTRELSLFSRFIENSDIQDSLEQQKILSSITPMFSKLDRGFLFKSIKPVYRNRLNQINECLIEENKKFIKLNERYHIQQEKRIKNFKKKEELRKLNNRISVLNRNYLKKEYVLSFLEKNDREFINSFLDHIRKNFKLNVKNRPVSVKSLEGFTWENHKIKPEWIVWNIKKFPKIHDEYLEVLREGKDKIEKNHEKKIMGFYKSGEGFRKYIRTGDFSKELNIPEYFVKRIQKSNKEEIKKIKIDYFRSSWNKWIEEGKKRTLDYLNDGFHYNHSLHMGGLGTGISRKQSFDVIQKDKEFEKQFSVHYKRFKGNKRKNLSEEGIEKLSNYIKKLKDLKTKIENENKDLYKGLTDKHYMFRYHVSYQSKSFFNNHPPPVYLLYLKKVLIILINKETNKLNHYQSVLKERNKFKESLLKLIPEKDRKRVVSVSPKGTYFFDVNKNVIYKTCFSCGVTKPRDHYPPSNQIKNCLSCINVSRFGTTKPKFKSDWKNGVLIKKRNSNHVITHLRCNSCNEFKLKRRFLHLHRGSRVCSDCYVELPNNVLTKRGEFVTRKGKRIQVRRYDELTFHIKEKRCNSCNEFKPINDYSLDRKNKIDGKGGECKSCISMRYKIKKSIKK